MKRMEGWEQRDFVAHKPYSREELCCESIASGHLKPSELWSTWALLKGSFLTSAWRANLMDAREINHPATGSGSVDGTSPLCGSSAPVPVFPGPAHPWMRLFLCWWRLHLTILRTKVVWVFFYFTFTNLRFSLSPAQHSKHLLIPGLWPNSWP